MLKACGAKVTEQLRHMFIRRDLCRLNLDEKDLFHDKVGEKITEQRPIFIADFDRKLRAYFHASLAQSMD